MINLISIPFDRPKVSSKFVFQTYRTVVLLEAFLIADLGEPEAERMTAANAKVFGPPASDLVNRNEVAH